MVALQFFANGKYCCCQILYVQLSITSQSLVWKVLFILCLQSEPFYKNVAYVLRKTSSDAKFHIKGVKQLFGTII